jgi:hypothetical protein
MLTTDTFEKALDLLELGYTFPSITDETGITIEAAEAVHTGPFETSSPREQCVSGCRRSEEVRHQGSGLTSIGGIRLAELGTQPLFFHRVSKKHRPIPPFPFPSGSLSQ